MQMWIVKWSTRDRVSGCWYCTEVRTQFRVYQDSVAFSYPHLFEFLYRGEPQRQQLTLSNYTYYHTLLIPTLQSLSYSVVLSGTCFGLALWLATLVAMRYMYNRNTLIVEDELTLVSDQLLGICRLHN
jgi:hypothetical protein